MLPVSDFQSGLEPLALYCRFVFPEFALINNFFSAGNVSASRYHQPKTLIQSGHRICKLYQTSRPGELLIKGWIFSNINSMFFLYGPIHPEIQSDLTSLLLYTIFHN